MFPYISQFPKIDKNLSVFLAVSFLDDSVENHVKVARINFDSFVGNVGGGMGLCLGFSIVSTVFLVFDTANSAIKRCLVEGAIPMLKKILLFLVADQTGS